MMENRAPRSRVGRLSCLIVLLLTLAACGPQPMAATPTPVTLTIVACDTCDTLLRDLAAGYQRERPRVTVEVRTFNTATVEAQLRSRSVDLIALPQTESTPLPAWSVPFANSAVVVVVHPTNPIEAIDTAQLREIFRGRVGEWADGTPIQLVSREAGAGTRAIFEARVMDGYDVALTAVVMPGDQEALDYVAAHPGAIGYVSLTQLGDGVRALPVDGVYPSPENLADYRLAFTLHLATPAEPTGEARTFIQWVLSPEGRRQMDQSLSPP